MRVPKFSAGGFAGGGSGYTSKAVKQGPTTGVQETLQMGEALSRFGKGVSALSQQYQNEVDEAEIQSSANLFDEYSRNVLDPKNGFRSKVGRDAKDGYDQEVKDLEAKRQEFGQRLTNQRQRDIYNKYSRNRADRTRYFIDNHASKEVRSFNIGEKEATLSGKVADYVGLSTMVDRDSQAEQRSMLEIKQAVNDLADMQAVGPEKRQQMLDTAVGGAREMTVSSLIDLGRLGEAEKALDSSEFNQIKEAGYRSQLKAAIKEQDRAAKLEASNERTRQLSNDLQDIVNSTADDDETIANEIENLVGTTDKVQYGTPAQRGVAIRQRVLEYVEREQRAGRMDAGQAASFQAQADNQVRVIRNRYLEEGNAAFQSAMQLLREDDGTVLEIEQMPSELQLRLEEFRQVDNVQAAINEVRQPQIDAAQEAIEAIEADQKNRRELFAMTLLEQLSVGGQVKIDKTVRQQAQELGLDLSAFPQDVPTNWKTMTQDQIQGSILALGVTKPTTYGSYLRKGLSLKKGALDNKRAQEQRAVDAVIDQIAIGANINLKFMRSTKSRDRSDINKRLDLMETYSNFRAQLADPQFLARFNLGENSTPNDWKLAAPSILDMISIETDRGDGMINPDDLSANSSYRQFATTEATGNLPFVPVGLSEAYSKFRMQTQRMTYQGDLEDLSNQISDGYGATEDQKAFVQYLRDVGYEPIRGSKKK